MSSYHLIVACFVAIVTKDIMEMSKDKMLMHMDILCFSCRKTDPEMMKMTASGKLNPPDLWIHHDQMELKQMQQHQTLLSSSSNEFDLIDDHRTTHSLDKRALRASRRGTKVNCY